MSSNLNEEIIILNEIYNLSKNINILMHSIQKEKTRLIERMDNVNNTYFEKNQGIQKKLNESLNNNLLSNMIQNMHELNKIVNNAILESCCEHNYIIDQETQNKVTYCSLCNIYLKPINA